MKDKACIFNIQKFSIHDGPGIRTVVFFKGCPLKCYWCSNPESQDGKPENMWDNQKKAVTTVGEYKTLDEIIEEVMKDEPFYEESGGGVTLSGGEVLYQAEFATELLRQLKEKGVHTASETTGFARAEVFKKYIEPLLSSLIRWGSLRSSCCLFISLEKKNTNTLRESTRCTISLSFIRKIWITLKRSLRTIRFPVRFTKKGVRAL